MTSSDTATPGRPCPWQPRQNDARSASTTGRRANGVPVRALTDAELATETTLAWLESLDFGQLPEALE